jgi:hypothetical protein
VGVSATPAMLSVREEFTRECERGARWSALERTKAQGSNRSSSRLTTSAKTRDSRRGQSPEVGAGRAGLRIRPQEQRSGKRHVGSSRTETFVILSGEGKAPKGEIPGALSA